MICKIPAFNSSGSIEGREVSHISMWLYDVEEEPEVLIATMDEIKRILEGCDPVNAPE